MHRLGLPQKITNLTKMTLQDEGTELVQKEMYQINLKYRKDSDKEAGYARFYLTSFLNWYYTSVKSKEII